MHDGTPFCTGVTFLHARAAGVRHGSGASTVSLGGGLGEVSGSLVLDATGHQRVLVEYDRTFDPGYQGAYGIIAGVATVSGLS